MSDRATLVSLLRERASRQPEEIAYTFLANGEKPEDPLTYQQLDGQARAIASHLQSCIYPGERVLLIYPQGLDFLAAFFGCLYAGAIAIPAPAPEASRLKRIRPLLESIICDAQCSVILGNSKSLWQLESLIKEFEIFNQINWIATDILAEQSEQESQELNINCDSIAYLQYTSGSTSAPKGVAITHHNLIDNLACITKAHGYTSESICASWIPHFHDYGLVNGLLQPLYAGIPCFIMSPVTFIKRPIRWLSAISQYHVTHSGGPCFAYEYCVQRTTPEQRQGLNLSKWRVAHTGAEPIRQQTLEQFARTFEPVGFNLRAFYPSYGLAEATLMVTTKKENNAPTFCTVSRRQLSQGRVVLLNQLEGETDSADLLSLTGCGYPTGDTKVAIVHPQTFRRCSVNEVGEIWVSSPSVAQGYWNRPDVTEQIFQAYLAETGEGPFLRTGDLGFLTNGELFVTGRLKDVIIILGSNHYPEDIEMTVKQSHPTLFVGGNAAFSVEIEGQERVIVVQEVNRIDQEKMNKKEIVDKIRQAVSARHEIQLYDVVLIPQGSIPKTSSGKIMRQACKVSFLEGKLDALSLNIKN